ncbi:MAG: hypothetical protein ACE5GB_10010 [Acidimicrobiales bacterium]
MVVPDHTDDPETDSSIDQLRSKVRLGERVAAALAVLTMVEYIIAVGVDDPIVWLIPFVIAKGALIMEYFMHASALFGGGDH